MLFRRYASPYLILDEVIASFKLCEFIDYIISEHHEQQLWDYWLHRVYNMSFSEYKRRCEKPEESYSMTNSQVNKVIEDTRKILRDIKPDRR